MRHKMHIKFDKIVRIGTLTAPENGNRETRMTQEINVSIWYVMASKTWTKFLSFFGRCDKKKMFDWFRFFRRAFSAYGGYNFLHSVLFFRLVFANRSTYRNSKTKTKPYSRPWSRSSGVPSGKRLTVVQVQDRSLKSSDLSKQSQLGQFDVRRNNYGKDCTLTCIQNNKKKHTVRRTTG